MQSLKENQSGFTLVELVIYIVVISTSAVLLTYLSIDLVTGAQKARVNQEVQQNARFAMQRIVQELRHANTVNTGSSTFGSSPGVLSLGVDTVGNDPTVFDVASEVLQITQGANGPYPLTTDKVRVTNLVFDNRSTPKTSNIKVTLTIEHVNPSNQETYNASQTLSTTVVVREDVD